MICLHPCDAGDRPVRRVHRWPLAGQIPGLVSAWALLVLMSISPPVGHVFCFSSSSYLVMPFMGTDLGKLMKLQRLSEEKIQYLVYQMLKGLKVGSATLITLIIWVLLFFWRTDSVSVSVYSFCWNHSQGRLFSYTLAWDTGCFHMVLSGVSCTVQYVVFLLLVCHWPSVIIIVSLLS